MHDPGIDLRMAICMISSIGSSSALRTGLRLVSHEASWKHGRIELVHGIENLGHMAVVH